MLLAFSLPVFSQDVNSPVAEFLAAAQEIAQKHPDVKPQLLKMGNALQVNIGQVKEQNRSAADDNRQASSDNREASANLDGIRSDNNDLGTIAEGLRRIGNSGETWPKK